MLMMKAIVVFHLTVVCSLGASAAESPLVIENSHLLLRFDAGTGAWTGLVDKHAGDDLVVAGAAPVSVAPAAPPVLDSAQVARRHHHRTGTGPGGRVALHTDAAQDRSHCGFSARTICRRALGLDASAQSARRR